MGRGAGLTSAGINEIIGGGVVKSLLGGVVGSRSHLTTSSSFYQYPFGNYLFGVGRNECWLRYSFAKSKLALKDGN